MEREIFQGDNRYLESKLYKRLLEFTPQEFDFRLEEFVKVARSSRPEEILYMIDVLSSFVCNDDEPVVKEQVLETVLDGLFDVLKYRDSDTVKELLSDKYCGIVNNLESIKDKSDSTMVSKIEELYEKEFFPSHKIDLDS